MGQNSFVTGIILACIFTFALHEQLHFLAESQINKDILKAIIGPSIFLLQADTNNTCSPSLVQLEAAIQAVCFKLHCASSWTQQKSQGKVKLNNTDTFGCHHHHHHWIPPAQQVAILVNNFF